MLDRISAILGAIATDLDSGKKIPYAPNDPPGGIAPPQDIDGLFPKRHINWRFSKDNSNVVVLCSEDFNKESIQKIINHKNFEKIVHVKEGTVFVFKNTYGNKP